MLITLGLVRRRWSAISRRRLSKSSRNSAAKRAAGAPSFTTLSSCHSQVQDVADRDLAVDDARALAHPPTMISRDIRVRGWMPKPPPPANVPTAVTATVPMSLPGSDRSGHHRGSLAGITPGSGSRSVRLAPATCRCCSAAGSRLTRRSSAVRSGTPRMSASRRRWEWRTALAAWRSPPSCPHRRAGGSPVALASCGRHRPFRVGAAAARATLATTKAVRRQASCPASSRFAVVMSTSTSPYMGVFRRPARAWPQ